MSLQQKQPRGIFILSKPLYVDKNAMKTFIDEELQFAGGSTVEFSSKRKLQYYYHNVKFTRDIPTVLSNFREEVLKRTLIALDRQYNHFTIDRLNAGETIERDEMSFVKNHTYETTICVLQGSCEINFQNTNYSILMNDGQALKIMDGAQKSRYVFTPSKSATPSYILTMRMV